MNTISSISGFGLDYEAPLTKRQARALCGMYPLPAVGEETLVAFNTDRFRLKVGNFSGSYVAFSADLPRTTWQARFGVTV